MNKKHSDQDMYIETGKRLCEYRKLSHLTQKQVGEKLGIKQETVSMIESGARRPSAVLLKQFAGLYNTTYDKLLGTPKPSGELLRDKPLKEIMSVDLLLSLCENTGSAELEQAVRSYLDMCVYCLMREIYECNPKNSDKLFLVDKDDALKQVMTYIEHTPVQLSAFIKATSSKIKKNNIELPLEKAADFREFIKQSESFILDNLTK